MWMCVKSKGCGNSMSWSEKSFYCETEQKALTIHQSQSLRGSCIQGFGSEEILSNSMAQSDPLSGLSLLQFWAGFLLCDPPRPQRCFSGILGPCTSFTDGPPRRHLTEEHVESGYLEIPSLHALYHRAVSLLESLSNWCAARQ
jgi:hypothetical protein